MALDSIPEHRHDAFDSLWRLASSGRLTLALLALLGATLALAAILPQLPIELDSTAAERWLGTTAASYRELGTPLRAIGAFDILQSLWLRVLLALLAYNLALRLVDQLRRVREAWRPISISAPRPPDLPARRLTLDGYLEAALNAVQEAMRSCYPELAWAAEADLARVYGRRRRAGTLGAPLLSLGLLLLLAGLVVDGTAGWRTADLSLAANSSASLSVGGGLQLLLDKIEGEGGETQSTITVTRSDGRQERLSAGYIRPARSGNLWIVQRAIGPALQARAHSGDRPLLLQSLAAGGEISGEINAPFRQTQTELAFAIPGRNLAFRVVSYNALPQQGIQGPVFLVEAYRGESATPFLTQLVEQATTLSIEDITVDLRRERYVILAAAYLPGLAYIAFGLALTLIGVIMLIVWGYTETWVNLLVGEQTIVAAIYTAAPWRARAECVRLSRAVATTSSAESVEPRRPSAPENGDLSSTGG